MDELLEVLAERSHIGWMKEKQAQGWADHAYQSAWQEGFGHPEICGLCPLPKDKHHPDMLPYADLAENVKEYDRATVRGVLDGIAELLEILAEGSHRSWMAEKQAQGFADHVFDQNPYYGVPGGRGANPCLRCDKNSLKHHPDMLPYADLPESTKDYVRATVRGVLDGIEAAGWVVTPRGGPKAVTLG